MDTLETLLFLLQKHLKTSQENTVHNSHSLKWRNMLYFLLWKWKVVMPSFRNPWLHHTCTESLILSTTHQDAQSKSYHSKIVKQCAFPRACSHFGWLFHWLWAHAWFLKASLKLCICMSICNFEILKISLHWKLYYHAHYIVFTLQGVWLVSRTT